jgi:predicted PurR-regulated permease PerM
MNRIMETKRDRRFWLAERRTRSVSIILTILAVIFVLTILNAVISPTVCRGMVSAPDQYITGSDHFWVILPRKDNEKGWDVGIGGVRKARWIDTQNLSSYFRPD